MDLDGGEWAVELGPIASMKFREDAISYLDSTLDGFDREVSAKVLADERVRVAEGLNEKTADALAKRLGRQETLARAARGPAPQAGMAGAFRNGLPFIGVGLAPILGLAIHPVGWIVGLALGAGLAWKNTTIRMKVLGSAPVGAITDASLDASIERYVELKSALTDGAYEDLTAVVTQSVTMLTASNDPDDMMALSIGSYDSLLADSASKMIQKAVGLADTVSNDGRNSFNSEEKATLTSLLDLGNRALSKSRGESVGSLEQQVVESSSDVEMEALAELEHELEI